jgi:hypothetical protein
MRFLWVAQLAHDDLDAIYQRTKRRRLKVLDGPTGLAAVVMFVLLKNVFETAYEHASRAEVALWCGSATVCLVLFWLMWRDTDYRAALNRACIEEFGRRRELDQRGPQQ